MPPPNLPWQHGASLLVAKRHHQVEAGWIDRVHGLRILAIYVDTDLGHGLDGMRI